MLKLKVLGNYAPNLKGLPGSCYILRGLEKIIILDMGYGNLQKVLNEIKENELENIIIILSHNHLDHSFDVLKFAKVLKKLNKKVKIYLPKKSIIYYIVAKNKKFFDVQILNEKTKIELNEAIIDFCKTNHSGECYATRIKYNSKVFIYTSDFSSVSEKLKIFCKNADILVIDTGIPIQNKIHLKNFHSNTRETIKELFSKKCNVKEVMASHLKAYLSDSNYINLFPRDKNIYLIKMGCEYELF